MGTATYVSFRKRTAAGVWWFDWRVWLASGSLVQRTWRPSASLVSSRSSARGSSRSPGPASISGVVTSLFVVTPSSVVATLSVVATPPVERTRNTTTPTTQYRMWCRTTARGKVVGSGCQGGVRLRSSPGRIRTTPRRSCSVTSLRSVLCAGCVSSRSNLPRILGARGVLAPSSPGRIRTAVNGSKGRYDWPLHHGTTSLRTCARVHKIRVLGPPTTRPYDHDLQRRAAQSAPVRSSSAHWSAAGSKQSGHWGSRSMMVSRRSATVSSMTLSSSRASRRNSSTSRTL